MNKRSKELENGFTLVEIIASITILGIIVIILFPIFTNVMDHSTNAEDRMITGNLLAKVSKDLRESRDLAEYLSSLTIEANCSIEEQKIPESRLPHEGFYDVDGKDFQIEVFICQSNSEEHNEKELDLVRTRLKISSPEGKETSESFIYLSKAGGTS